MEQNTAFKNYNLNSVQPFDSSSSLITFSWLLLLRWGAVVCQLLLVCMVWLFFEVQVPWIVLGAIFLFEGISNIYFANLKRKRRDISQLLFAIVMFLDVGLLTCLLHFTGGPMNPFTFLFLVHVVLGAIIMRPQWSWLLTFTTIGCYGLLFILPESEMVGQLITGSTEEVKVICVDVAALDQHMSLHLHGMWLAFSVTAIFIVFFVGRIQKALQTHQADLTKLKEEKTRTDKLAALATLSAGAAHEFSTPLSTIAVAAGEMLYSLKNQEEMDEVREDAELIRDQVSRCKDILFQMSSDAGEHLGESMEQHTLSELIEQVLSPLPSSDQNRIKVHNDIEELSFHLPFRSLRRTLRGLLDNGLDVSSETEEVSLHCWLRDGFLFFEVRDHGHGMEPGIIQRAAEPFFTTKEPGKGLGLGLFLAQSLAERFGGELHIESTPGHGSRVRLSFNLEQIQGSTEETG